ncbi:hypothetical protein [Fulvivirga ligni]|uniref:hypothetical protein n=1 Tax=Fulvivirga ligni TaxID=2904246 RepID=UPI001F3FCC8D|nr:hypothetical protein [Fulvivirga ligni]UII19632.1 hypothetical protein LVD16_17470 [Fulvivirga ligni]
MKYLTVVCAMVLVGLSQSVQAQSRNELQGPEAKNYKVWKYGAEPKEVVTVSKVTVQGPEAKNMSVAERNDNATTTQIKTSEKPRLMGPKAKNYKPWKKKD